MTKKIATDNNFATENTYFQISVKEGGAVEELFWYLIEKVEEQCGVLFNGIFRSTLHHTLSDY